MMRDGYNLINLHKCIPDLQEFKFQSWFISLFDHYVSIAILRILYFVKNSVYYEEYGFDRKWSIVGCR